jgi:glycosyltransferase involved in cell wall biosynthesis
VGEDVKTERRQPGAEHRAVVRGTNGRGAVGGAGIVVPTHNDGANIGPLLTRLLTEPEVDEIVVVASGCDDETVATVTRLAAEHPDTVRLYVERERSGKVAAVNFGLAQLRTPVLVVVSGDVLPDHGAIGKVVRALREPGVGLAGGRPVPVNDAGSAIGHAAHLLWRLHHRLALHQPKLGEMIAIRAEAVVALPRTSVDEACFQALLEGAGWRSVYVPDAVVWNRGPGTTADFVGQRRQIHTGHLWLRRRQHYAVPSMRLGLLGSELWNDVRTEPRGMRPTQLAWTAAAVGMEAWARLLARIDYLQGKENHVWAMVPSTKAPAPDADGVGVRDR